MGGAYEIGGGWGLVARTMGWGMVAEGWADVEVGVKTHGPLVGVGLEVPSWVPTSYVYLSISHDEQLL
jgi:hypothetical protein